MQPIQKTLILFSLSFTAVAQQDTDRLMESESSFLDEMPIVLSATRLPQPIDEAPLAITVIDREMIEASGARTIPDLMRMVPGFQVGYFDGNSPVTTYHGHGDEYSRRVQVLVDGRSVYVPTLAGIQWSDHITSIDDIARIEVTRGPNAASYGNNSFLAVISITTRNAIEDHGHKIKIVQGSQDTHEGYYRFGDSTDNFDYRVTVGSEHDDGTDLLNDYTRADYLSYRLDKQVDVDNFLSYQGGYKDIRLGDHESPPDFQIEVQSAFQWLKWEHTTNDNNSLSLQYYYNFHDEDLTHENAWFNPPGLDPFQPKGVTILSERHDLELSYTLNMNNFRLVTGASARTDIVSAENVFRSNDKLHHELYRGFAHAEYRYQQDWLFNTGFMIENNDISGTDFAPRLSVIHHINKNNTIRLGASKATRTPTLYDQNAYLVINEQLKQNGIPITDPDLLCQLGGGNSAADCPPFIPTDILNSVDLISNGNIDSEEIESIELGYIARLMNNQLTLDIKVFKDNTDKLIFTSGVPTEEPEDNLDGEADEILNTHRTETEGTEIALDYKLPKNYRLYTHYTYIDISAEMYNPLGYWRETRRLTMSAPKKTFGLTLIKHWATNFDASINYYHISDMDWLDRTGSTSPYFSDRSAQPYNKLDIKLSKAYIFGNEKLRINFIMQNLLEDHYDYNKTRYTDATLTTVFQNTDINAHGSLQDMRTYLEVSLEFN